MKQPDLDKTYFSPIDILLHKLHEEHDRSQSQMNEISKHKRIHALRDRRSTPAQTVVWDKF